MKSRNSRIPASLALACLFSALCCASAYISLPMPVGPVPLTLTNLFVVLGGLTLGPAYGGLAALLYLAIGALGFPVFSGGGGGLAHFAGPTGGYLVGYAVAAALAGLFARARRPWSTVVGSIVGFAAILVLGGIGLKLILGLGWQRAMTVGIIPFLIGDSIKAALAAVIAIRLGPFADSLTGRVHAPS